MKYANKTCLLIAGIFFLGSSQILAQDSKETPPELTAALLMKVLGFEKNISSSKSVTVFVLGDVDVAKELKKGIGKKIGKSELSAVTYGDTLPEKLPTVLFVGTEKDLEKTVKYTREAKRLSATGIPDLVTKGVSLGFGINKKGKPVIFLNLASSKKEELNWNPAILKVAKIIK